MINKMRFALSVTNSISISSTKHCSLLILWLLAISSSVFGTNYYVDASNGNDNNSGLNLSTSWKSLDKVNQTDFLPGDSVLFKRNCVWDGTLFIRNAGNLSEFIVFSSYGTGNKPLINGGGNALAGIFIKNSASYVTVEGFAVTNFDSLDVFDGAEGLRSGIQIGEWSGNQRQISILNNEVYFIEGCSNHPVSGPPRGTNLDPNTYNLYQNAAIFCHSSIIDSLIIEGNYIHDCTCTGISAFLFEMATHLLIQHNSVYNVGADGIVVFHAQSPLIQLNACISAGNNSGPTPRVAGELGYNGLAVVGIWSTLCSDPLFQYNYCEGTKRIVWDGQAWDFDLNTTGNAIYQFNYSRDNEGGFNLGGSPNQIFRYNISFNDGAKQGNSQYFFNGEPSYYNNVFYRTDGAGFLLNHDEQQSFYNNIFYCTNSDSLEYETGTLTFENNCFSGHNPLNSGSDPILQDPLFLNPGVAGKILPGQIFSKEDLREVVSGFKLTAGSTCINAGHDIPNKGNEDFWGNPLYQKTADVGAHEFTGNVSFVQEAFSELDFMIFPNPASTFLFVRKMESTMRFYRICDANGKVLQSDKIEGNEGKIDISRLINGIFLLQIYDKSGFKGTRKFVKMCFEDKD